MRGSYVVEVTGTPGDSPYFAAWSQAFRTACVAGWSTWISPAADDLPTVHGRTQVTAGSPIAAAMIVVDALEAAGAGAITAVSAHPGRTA